jgi:hypothetical protein
MLMIYRLCRSVCAPEAKLWRVVKAASCSASPARDLQGEVALAR